MSHRLRNLVSPIAVMVGILVVGMATPARADLEIWASTTNNPPVAADKVAFGTSTASFSGVIDGYTISMLATGTNSPGTASLALETGSTLTITNTGGTTNHLFITLGSTGFTMPVTPPNIRMLSHVGGTIPVADAANTLKFQSYVDNVTPNGQNTVVGITTGPQTPDITGAGTGSFNSDAPQVTITSLAATYSMTEYFDLFLSTGSTINFASSTTLTNIVVPEPSSLALAGLGALGMIGYGLRRHKALGA